jgi:hypothetical protein
MCLLLTITFYIKGVSYALKLEYYSKNIAHKLNYGLKYQYVVLSLLASMKKFIYAKYTALVLKHR